MVASNTEIEDITNIICQWVPETYAYDMMTEIWDNCVQFSDNESLRLTVQGLIAEIERQDHVKFDGIEELK
jgi:hypothetical protein|tara:strand:- start:1233 stop:1445 length:213 start_codon:yes stop_codon:yes gene_type:complete